MTRLFPVIPCNNCVVDFLQELFAPYDESRFSFVLRLVGSHVTPTVAITGSTAIEWRCRTRGDQVRRRQLNDIDLVADEVRPAVANDFLIHHFHPAREKGNVLMQLVEPRTATRVDIFSPRSAGLYGRTSEMHLDGVDAVVVSAEDLAARLLAIISIVCEAKSIDPKYVDSFSRLLQLVDQEQTAKLWSEYRRSTDPEDFTKTWLQVQATLASRTDLLRVAEYDRDTTTPCSWCVDSPDFPIAPREKVFQVLGYV